MSTTIQKWLIVATTIVLLGVFASCSALVINNNNYYANLCGPNGFVTSEPVNISNPSQGSRYVCKPKP